MTKRYNNQKQVKESNLEKTRHRDLAPAQNPKLEKELRKNQAKKLKNNYKGVTWLLLQPEWEAEQEAVLLLSLQK